MNPADLPIARELFAQWQRARGGRVEPASRPFSRGWEELLEDARLVSASDRSAAEQDARTLETGGWIELKPVRYRPHLIDRVLIPLDAEARWREAFGFVTPSKQEAREIREFPWEPELSFLRDARLGLSFAELRRLNAFLNDRGRERVMVPIKERSLQIFGDEKRLDILCSSTLFQPGRLVLDTHLFCEVIGVPLAWKRGPSSASAQPIIAIENAATWHSYCRWNAERALFSAVVYGDGNRFVDGIRYLKDLFAELGGARRVLYFGDLDPQGLLIPQEASARAQAAALPANEPHQSAPGERASRPLLLASTLPVIEPHLWSYRHLLTFATSHGQPWEGDPPSRSLCDWLGDLAEPARRLFASGHRLAQERISWEFLRDRAGMD